MCTFGILSSIRMTKGFIRINNLMRHIAQQAIDRCGHTSGSEVGRSRIPISKQFRRDQYSVQRDSLDMEVSSHSELGTFCIIFQEF